MIELLKCALVVLLDPFLGVDLLVVLRDCNGLVIVLEDLHTKIRESLRELRANGEYLS